MASSNNNLQLASLDFAQIKNNFINYLKTQDILKDYDYTGSALSVLLDLLAYNTTYNGFYLNMVANEMFLDSAIQRSSVVSKAKEIGYTPKSAIAPTAVINMDVHNVVQSSLTLPKNTRFLSGAIDGVNYTFLASDETTVNTANNIASFTNISLKQAIPGNFSFVVDTVSNPNLVFEIPDPNIDTTTIQVLVQKSSSNAAYTIFTQATSYLTLDGTNPVYFLQEGYTGNYQIIFGDGIIGQTLVDGNIVRVSYLSTKGVSGAGANSFTLMDSINGYGTVTIYPVLSATQGGNKESIESIKYQAPRAYSAQGRAVTKDDYITAIQQNTLGIAFDAVNVWGGEENSPPVYGQAFIAMKPTGAYTLTQSQKQMLIDKVIKPISVITVEPTIVDPDYTYFIVTVNVVYNTNKTTMTSAQVSSLVTSVVNTYAQQNLNTFNSTLSISDLMIAIQNSDNSIITNEVIIQAQKRIVPNLSNPTTYKMYFGASLQKGMFMSGLTSSPSFKVRDPQTLSNTIDGVYLEEVPSSSGGVESLSIINPGYSYQYTPTIEILGDGSGATAIATLTSSGSLKNVVLQTPGINYTSAIAIVTPQPGDTTGQGAVVIVNLQGRYGVIRSYYNNTENAKTILNNNVGTIDYINGIVTLNSFNALDINNALGILSVTMKPTTTIISSSYNRIITIDPFDANSIVVNVTAKKV